MSHQLKDAVRDGAYYIAVVCLFLLSLTIPVLNMISVWFLPLPFVILGVLQTRSTTLIVVLVLTLFSLFLDIGVALYVWIAFVTGYFMGRVYREPHTSASQVVKGGMIGGTVSTLTALYVTFVLSNAVNHIQKQWEEMWHNSVQLKSLGLDQAPPLEVLIPRCILLFLTILVLLNLWAARKWLIYKGFPGKYLPRFHNWNVPKSFFYAYLVALIWFLLVGENADEAMARYLLSFINILSAVFMVQGFTFLTYVLYINKRSRAWVLLLIPLVFTPLSTVMQLIGIVDVGAGLKKKLTRS